MDKKLKQLFDFQKFEQNPRLTTMIEDVEKSVADVLTDDELDKVSAAGSGQNKPKKTEKKKQ